MNRIDRNGKLILEFESCRPMPSGEVRLDSGEKFSLPAMKPGQIHRVTLPGVKISQVISGVLPDDAKFRLNEVFTEKNK